MAATKFGSTTLPNPRVTAAGSRLAVRGTGGTVELADGTLLTDYTGRSRYAWRLRWEGLTATEYGTIMGLVETALATPSTINLQPPDLAGTYTVIVVPGSISAESFEVGTSTPYFNLELELEETE